MYSSPTMSTWLENLSQSISAANFSLSIGPHRPTESKIGLSEVINAPIQWGFITGFFLSTYLHYLARHLKWMRCVQETLSDCAVQVRYSVKLIFSFLVAVLLVPLFAAVMCVFAVYRRALKVVLQHEYKDRFCGLLEGHDANWVLEDAKCKSVINVLGTFQAENGSGAQMLMTLRKRLASRLLGKHQPHEKLFYRRGIKGGFAFWYKVPPSEIFIEDFVRFVDIPSESEDFVTHDEIKRWIGKAYNADLPKGHSTSWEILVSKKPLEPKGPVNTSKTPVLFRVHHSLGDGIALLRFVLDTIADKKSSTVDLWQKGQKIIMSRKMMTILRHKDEVYIPEASSGSRRNSLLVQINLPSIKEKLSKCLSFIRMIYQCPLVLNEQLLLRAVDKNSLHHAKNAELSEEKFINWYTEPEVSLFHKIKSIKATLPGVRFSDVLLTALSASLHRHFVDKWPKYQIPKQITIVIPTRMGPLSQKLELNNRFSVGLQTLPISPSAFTKEDCIANIQRTHKKSQELVSRFDLLINYWILGSASALIPLPVLGPMVHSKHCTMVLSNLPGPKETITIGSAQLRELAFWLPNRGSTGLGLTVITYNDRIQMGMGGDQTVFDDPQEESHRVMADLVGEVDKMYSLLCD